MCSAICRFVSCFCWSRAADSFPSFRSLWLSISLIFRASPRASRWPPFSRAHASPRAHCARGVLLEHSLDSGLGTGSFACNALLGLEVRRKLNGNHRDQNQHHDAIQPLAANIFPEKHLHLNRSRADCRGEPGAARHKCAHSRSAHQACVIIMTQRATPRWIRGGSGARDCIDRHPSAGQTPMIRLTYRQWGINPTELARRPCSSTTTSIGKLISKNHPVRASIRRSRTDLGLNSRRVMPAVIPGQATNCSLLNELEVFRL